VPVRYVTRSVVRRYKGCYGSVPRMPVKWHGPAENVPRSVLLDA